MQRVFSDPNPMIVGSMYSLLEHEGIEVVYRNENLVGGAGELAPGDTWMEVWVVNEADAARATTLIREALKRDTRSEWICNHCRESNPASFEVCWNCGEPAD